MIFKISRFVRKFFCIALVQHEYHGQNLKGYSQHNVCRAKHAFSKGSDRGGGGIVYQIIFVTSSTLE